LTGPETGEWFVDFSMNLLADHNEKFATVMLWALTVWSVSGQAAELKVDLNPPERRTDILTPHWENWAWPEGPSGSRNFGDVTVTFRAAPGGALAPVLFKGLLDYGAHMACDGIVVKEPAGDYGFDMILSGLTPGKHTIVTYHNEVWDRAPARFDVLVGETLQIKGFTPTKRATNDYEVGSAFLEIDAVAGKDVGVHFRPERSDANRSLIWSLVGGLNQSGKNAGYLDIRNNVVYNWTARTTDGGVVELNYVNNYYKPYPKNPFVKWLLKLDPINPAWGTEKYYMTGNVLEGFVNETNNWSAFYNGPVVEKQARVDKELYPSYVATQTANEAFTNVLASVGANYPKQDAIDRHIIADVRDGTAEFIGTRGPTYGDRPGPNYPGIIDTQSDDKSALGSPDFPWPEYKTCNVPVDTDHDGIPDDWEKAHGLNPNDPNDADGDCNGDGYTNLEKYLNSLVGEYSMTIE
jgi:hypothetical protein